MIGGIRSFAVSMDYLVNLYARRLAELAKRVENVEATSKALPKTAREPCPPCAYDADAPPTEAKANSMAMSIRMRLMPAL